MNNCPDWLSRQIAEAAKRMAQISPERVERIRAKYAQQTERPNRHSHGHNFLFPAD